MREPAPAEPGQAALKSDARIDNPRVAAVFAAYPPAVRARLLSLRRLILETARAVGVGKLEETLKWGVPSYLTSASGSGTTVRIHWNASLGDHVGLYVHCQTDLIGRYRQRYPTAFRYEGDRGLLLRSDAPIPEDALRDCIGQALTYHRDKRAQAGANRNLARHAQRAVN